MVHSRLVVSGKLRKAGQDVGRLSEATLFTPGRTAEGDSGYMEVMRDMNGRSLRKVSLAADWMVVPFTGRGNSTSKSVNKTRNLVVDVWAEVLVR